MAEHEDAIGEAHAQRRDPRSNGDRPSPDGEIDWSLGTFEGVRREQAREFLALSFREKLLRLEQMSELAARLRRDR